MFGTAKEKVLEILNSDSKPITQKSCSCNKDSIIFANKMKGFKKKHENTLLATADIVGLHPSIPHDAKMVSKIC